MSNLPGFPLGSKNEMLRFAQHDDKGADSCAGKASSSNIIGISRLPLRGSLEMTFGGEDPCLKHVISNPWKGCLY